MQNIYLLSCFSLSVSVLIFVFSFSVLLSSHIRHPALKINVQKMRYGGESSKFGGSVIAQNIMIAPINIIIVPITFFSMVFQFLVL